MSLKSFRNGGILEYGNVGNAGANKWMMRMNEKFKSVELK